MNQAVNQANVMDQTMNQTMNHIVICITGASGLPVAKRLLEALKEMGIQRSVVITEGAKRVANAEGLDLAEIEVLASEVLDEDDLDASISSTSNFPDAVVVVPASLKTIGLIAGGIPSNLVARVADNALRLGKPLILCPRETPLSAIDLENLATVARAGGIILPLNIAFYFKPESLDDLVDFLAGKVLDCLGLEHSLYKKWRESPVT